ncbi:MAG: EamA/RhaT family transporter [Bacteroidetes bacterium]|nr:MAG: EamA/RhaT family transporter [Bacteroidota bacterium]
MTINRKLLYTYIAMILAMFFWGFSFIWSKILLDLYNPITIVFLRLLISSLFLFIVGYLFKKLKPIAKEDFGKLLLLSFFQPFLYFIGETIGLKYVSSTTASVLIATIPLFTPIVAYYFLKEKFSILNIVGILISVFGVILVLFNDKFEISASTNGILLMSLAVFSAVFYSVLTVNLAAKYNVFNLITYQNAIGLLYFLPFFLYFDYDHFIQVKFTWEIAKPLFALAIFASSLAFMLFIYGIQVLGIIKANTISNIIPVFTAVFAWYILDEKLNWVNIIGILVVLSGLSLSQLNKAIHLKNIIIFRKINKKR